MSPGLSPAAFNPSGARTIPLLPPQPWHQEIAIPFLRHSQGKIDSKFLAANSSAPTDDSLDAAICRKSGAATLVPGNRLGASSLDMSGLGDLNAWNLDIHQSGA